MVKNANDRVEFGRGGYTGASDVARYLGISRPTVYRLMYAGKLRYTDIAGMLRIPRDAVHELVEKNLHGAGT